MEFKGKTAIITDGASGLGAATAHKLAEGSVQVGIFDTPLLQSAPDNVKQALGASVPNPARLGLPEVYASLALEMIRNSYFNGEDVRLDGAIHMAPL